MKNYLTNIHLNIDFLEKLILVFIGFSFVFKISISTPAILLLFFLNLNSISEKRKLNPLYGLLMIIFLLFYLMILLSCILIQEESNKILVKLLGFIFIPAVFFIKKFNKRDILYFIYSFVFFQLIHLLYADFVMFDAVYLKKLNTYSEINALIENKFIFERPYLALNCLIAIICLEYLYNEIKINFYIISTLILFIIVSLLLIAARLAMGVSILLFFSILFLNGKLKFKYFMIIPFIMVISIFTFGKHAIERITLKDGEPRIAIWYCAASIVKSENFNYLVGEFSSQRVDDKLVECYNSKPVSEGPYWWIGEKKYNYNTHNQFLWFFTSYGILGLSLFIAIFVLHIINFFKNRNIYSLLFVIVFFSQSIFENILSRQLGIYLFVWFCCILFSERHLNYEE